MYWQKRLNEINPNEEIGNLIKKITEKHNGNYGYRRIDLELRKSGHIVNHKKILRITNKLGITCVKFTRKSRKLSTYKGTVGKTSKNLINRRFIIKKAYLDPYLDMFSGEIATFRVSNRPNAKAILGALDDAINILEDYPYRRTIHSDQGWGYQMNAFVKKLKDNNIFQSMSRRGNCLDNSPMENFFSLMKQEIYYGETYHSFEELK